MNRELQKNIVKWQRRASARREDGIFITEGIKMFRELPKERMRHIVLSEHFRETEPETASSAMDLSAKLRGCTVDVIPDRDFQKLTDTDTPQGILAVAERFSYSPEEILNVPDGLFVFLENLQDPGNLGTIVRSAEAAGASGILMSPDCADIYNPKVIRSTMGSLYRVKFAVAQDLTEWIRRFRENGGRTYAAHLKQSVDYDAPSYRGKTAFLIGNESRGLSDRVTEAADACVRIPMQGHVESLNAAMAATILMYEAARQRKS